MNIKKITAAAVAAAILATAAPITGIIPDVMSVTASAYVEWAEDAMGFTEGDLTYRELTDGTLSVIDIANDIDNNVTNVIIPSEVNGKKVTQIHIDTPNYYENITSVTIPNTVTQVCGLLRFTNITTIHIPSSVTEITPFAFHGCTKLTEIDIDTDNPNYCFENGMMFNKDKTIFYGHLSYITNLVIPASVNTYRVFNGSIDCPLNAAFGELYGKDYLTSINVEAGNKNFSSQDGVLFNKDKSELLCYPQCKTDAEYTIPESVKRVGFGAFSTENKHLKTLNIKNNIEVFYPCVSTTVGASDAPEHIGIDTINYEGTERHWKRVFDNDDFNGATINFGGKTCDFKLFNQGIYQDEVAYINETLLPDIPDGWNYYIKAEIATSEDVANSLQYTPVIFKAEMGKGEFKPENVLKINGEITIKRLTRNSPKVYYADNGKYINMNAIIENVSVEYGDMYDDYNDLQLVAFKTKNFDVGTPKFIFTSQNLSTGGSSGGSSSGGSSSGGSASGGNSSGGSSSGSSSSGGSSSSSGGSSSSTSTYLSVTNKIIPNDKNAIADTARVDAKPGETNTDNSGAAVKVAKSDSTVSYVKIDAPTSTAEAANWAEPIVKKANSSKLAAVKKAAEEALGAIADNKGFALNIDILNTNRKTIEPKGNVEVTVPVPAEYKGKNLYTYRVTERGIVPIFATTTNNKITFSAGGAGEYIFTTKKLTNALTYEKGNVDLEGKPNAKDATAVLKHIVELNTLKDEQLFIADVNGDGKVNAKDATQILKMVAGLA